MRTKLELDLYQLKNIMADMVQVGYMKAIKVYEPTKDNISTRELVRWFKTLGVDPSYINKMESEGLIKAKEKEPVKILRYAILDWRLNKLWLRLT